MKTASRSMVRFAPPLLALTAVGWYAARTVAGGPPTVRELAHQAISTDSRAAQAAIAALRAREAAGLQALFTAYDGEIRQHIASADENARWQRIAHAIDEVGQQKDDYAAGLYWYTDLEKAERAAKLSGKPILSLRLLGHLNEDLSCANSRFFRTVLYPNARISQYLRANYILHWSSERPVPTFTLDFGDGRKIVRTLTGNSIHYILDSQGRLVDALPGLYGPQAFLRHLTTDAEVAGNAGREDDEAQRAYVQQWHHQQFDALAVQWTEETTLLFGKNKAPTLVALIAPFGNPRTPGSAPPGAGLAGTIAVSKSVAELPVISALPLSNPWAGGPTPPEMGWDQMGQRHREDAALDRNSRTVLASMHPDLSRVSDAPVDTFPGEFRLVRQAPPSAPPSARSAMDRLVDSFERSVAQDSIRNEFVLHAKIHQWFLNGQVTGDMAALNRRVYSDLFLTPSSDPYLGLAPGGVYTALPHDGLIAESQNAR